MKKLIDIVRKLVIAGMISGEVQAQDINKIIEDIKQGKYKQNIPITYALPQITNQNNKPVADKKFYALMGALELSTFYDMETTFDGINNRNLREGNPFVKPFVESGRPATYAMQHLINGGVGYLTYYFKKKGDKNWWIPALIPIGIHTFAGAYNLSKR